MKKALLMAVAIGATAPAWAEWERVGENDSGTVFYMDFSTVRLSGAGAIRRVWAVMDSKKPDPNHGVHSRKVLYEYDCEGERYRWLQFLSYSKPQGGGDLIVSRSKPDEWSYVAPETMAESMMAQVCLIAPAYVRK